MQNNICNVSTKDFDIRLNIWLVVFNNRTFRSWLAAHACTKSELRSEVFRFLKSGNLVFGTPSLIFGIPRIALPLPVLLQMIDNPGYQVYSISQNPFRTPGNTQNLKPGRLSISTKFNRQFRGSLITIGIRYYGLLGQAEISAAEGSPQLTESTRFG